VWRECTAKTMRLLSSAIHENRSSSVKETFQCRIANHGCSCAGFYCS
jgi:hypothetical protein